MTTYETLGSDSIALPDGTIWSHAATLGSYKKGDVAFTFDQNNVDNICRVFAKGYPRKIPVSYHHGLESDHPAIVVARAKGEIPKAGDVHEMKGVYSADDFTGELKTAAERLAKRAGRELNDPDNLGLWMRWQPTARALAAIQAGEVTELSPFFTNHCLSDTGEDQGYAVLSVALLNLPFLDKMLSVAAGRDITPPTGDRSMSDSANRVHTSLAAVVGAPVTSDDDAVQRLTALGVELSRLRDTTTHLTNLSTQQTAQLTALTQELGAADGDKALEVVRRIKAENRRNAEVIALERKKRVDGDIETVRAAYEKKDVPPAFFDGVVVDSLRTQLESGVKLEDTSAMKQLTSLPHFKITGRNSGADEGGDALAADIDARLDRTAIQLLQSEPDLKAEAATNYDSAYSKALALAARQIGYTSPQMRLVRAKEKAGNVATA